MDTTPHWVRRRVYTCPQFHGAYEGSPVARRRILVVLGLAGLGALIVGVLVTLVAVTKLPGEEKTPAGLRRDTALYIKMRDGVQIAADLWLPPVRR
jgi:predicted acyl esterase